MQKITSEKAFDLLPYAVDIFDKLQIDKVGAEIAKKNKTKDTTIKQKEVGVEIIKYILKNSGKVKEEFFNIVAIVQDITIEEAKKLSLFETIKTVKAIFENDDLMGFFG